jgi:hypothetical protein
MKLRELGLVIYDTVWFGRWEPIAIRKMEAAVFLKKNIVTTNKVATLKKI